MLHTPGLVFVVFIVGGSVLVDSMRSVVAAKSVLDHPFYSVLWVEGSLPADGMSYYLGQWRHYESHFTRFISSAHVLCDVPEVRQVLVENAAEEEGVGGQPSHLSLWDKFCGVVGCCEGDMVPDGRTQGLVDTYYELARSSWQHGVCAMYAYEAQAAEVSATKLKSLVEKFDISSEGALAFFKLHAEVDVWHTKQWEDVIAKYFDDKVDAAAMVDKACSALLSFLDGNMEYLRSRGYTELCDSCC